MKRYRLATSLGMVVGCLALAALAVIVPLNVSQAEGVSHYSLSWSALTGGGGVAQSAHYGLSGSLGQGSVGISSSPHYRLGGGFWFVQGVPQLPSGGRLYLPAILK